MLLVSKTTLRHTAEELVDLLLHPLLPSHGSASAPLLDSSRTRKLAFRH